MLNRLVVGTLTTLSTMMSPLGGGPEDAKSLTFKLEAPLEQRLTCPLLEHQPLILKVQPVPDSRIRFQISGRVCAEGKKPEAVLTGFSLPMALLEHKFIEDLPLGIPYVVSEAAFGIASETGQNRLKLTKREPAPGLVALLIEWVPGTATERPRHEPVTFWLRKLPAENEARKSLVWERIEMQGLKKLSGHRLALVEAKEAPNSQGKTH